MNELLISTMIKVIHYIDDWRIIDSGELKYGNDHYHGITWNDDELFVSGAKSGKDGFYVYDKKTFKQLDFNDSMNLHHTHQIFYTNGKLYLVNTGKNRIEILSDKIEQKVFNESPCDVDHLNGIWSDGDYFYVTEFRNKNEEPSAVRICDLDLNLLDTVEIGLGVHNIYVENGKMYNLMSKRWGIHVTDLESREKDFIDLPELEKMLIRGLVRTESKWYIGASRWETERDKRHVGDGVLLILDNNFAPIDKIIMPDVGPICDIRVMDELDLAHNGILY